MVVNKALTHDEKCKRRVCDILSTTFIHRRKVVKQLIKAERKLEYNTL